MVPEPAKRAVGGFLACSGPFVQCIGEKRLCGVFPLFFPPFLSDKSEAVGQKRRTDYQAMQDADQKQLDGTADFALRVFHCIPPFWRFSIRWFCRSIWSIIV